jgi:DNA-binding NarL/FixJ family response regulator
MKKSKYYKSGQIVRVAVVEDHTVVRQALVMLLKKEPQIVVAFQAENGKDFFEKIANHQIDIVLLDLDMPVMDGKETLQILRKDYPDVKAIMLSMHDDLWMISELITLGAKSYLKKNCSFDELIDALFDVKFKGNYSNDLVSQALFSRFENQNTREGSLIKFKLNQREINILTMICDGKTSYQMSEKLNLSRKSIDAIRSNLSKRIGANNPAEFVRKSILLGLYIIRTDEQIEQEESLEKHRKMERKNSRLIDLTNNSENKK